MCPEIPPHARIVPANTSPARGISLLALPQVFRIALALVMLAVSMVLSGCDSRGNQWAAVAGPQPAPKPIDCSVVLYGDSIMHGGYSNDTGEKRHPRYLAAELKSRGPAWIVDDRTVSGQSLRKMAKAFYKETRSAHVVVLGSGIAEAWSGEDVKQQLGRLVQDVRREGRIPVLTGYARQLPNSFMTPDKMAGRDRADADVKVLAADLGVAFADFAVAEPVEIVDFVHPTQAYSLRLTEQLIQALNEVAPECKAAPI